MFFLLSILSFFGKAGPAGNVFGRITEWMFGLGRFAIPFLILAASYVLFTSHKRKSYIPILIGVFLFFSGFLGILHLLSSGGGIQGGYWGYFVSLPFVPLFGKTASFIIFIGLIVTSVIIGLNIRVGKILAERRAQILEKRAKEVGGEGAQSSIGGRKPRTVLGTLARLALGRSGEMAREELKVKTWKDGEDRETDAKHDVKQAGKEGGTVTELAVSRLPRAELRGEFSGKEKNEKDFEIKSTTFADTDFRLPPLELLEKETGRPSSGDIVANANIIKRTLQNFGVDVEMGEVNVGPTVTQFTLKPAEGVKLSRILALHNDLSLALAAHPIRIEAPIPGRSLVGIEIPNKGITLVRLKNLLQSEEFHKRQSNLTFALGRDVSGAGVYANVAKMPHLLIAGSTGSGKTVCLNVLILSLLYQNSPAMVKFLLVDPKRVEFPIFSDIPHLLAPVVVDTQKTVNALKWAVSEMERRFEILASARTRDIGNFNSSKKAVLEYGALPYIVVIIDELADLMAARGKEIEALIVRLAQMSRAVGIHLVLATQRPSVEVITGLIKANITTRIAFQVASQVDSRTVLDMAGAEKLLGNGDMLYLAGDASKPRRVQGAYANEKEVRRIADYLREEGSKLRETEETEADGTETDHGSVTVPLMSNITSASLKPSMQPHTANFSSSGTDARVRDWSGPSDSILDFVDTGGNNGNDDELYEEARKVVIQSQKASASLLQRRLRVGYARAARLIDMLEEEGIVGPGEGAKPREVYIGREEA